MREFQVTGNLGSDPEVMTSKNGENYVRMRLANHEPTDKEGETRWFDVVMFSTPKIMPYLKKGTGVRVYGDYTDELFNSDKYGPQISRKIVANKIDFHNNYRKTDEQNGTQPQPAETYTPAPQPAPQPVAATAPKTTVQVSPPVQETAQSDDDDLPF